MRGQASGIGVGAVQAFVTSDGGHPPEFWIDDTLRQIVHVSDTAPAPIREQAMAFREQIRAVLDAGIRNAIRSDHTTIIHRLTQAGMHEAAALIQTIRS